MNRSKSLIAVAGAMLVGATALLPSIAEAGGNVGWSVSIGGPGFAVSAGQPAYGPGYAGAIYPGAPYRPNVRPYVRPYYRPVVVAPPVVYEPWFAPVVLPRPYPAYAPRAVVYARPAVVPVRRHYPVSAPVAPRPYRY